MSETKPLWARIWAVTKTTLFFALFGPIVGMPVFWFGYNLLESGFSAATFALVLLFPPFGFFGIPAAFYVGFLPALFSGLIVGIYTSFIGVLRWPIALVIGGMIGFLHVMLIGNGDMPPPKTIAPEVALQSLMILTCAVVTLVCWLSLDMKVLEPSVNPGGNN